MTNDRPLILPKPGVAETIYQGAYQFNELSHAWFPQVVLVNESGLFEKH
jgi:hypothetical protein